MNLLLSKAEAIASFLLDRQLSTCEAETILAQQEVEHVKGHILASPEFADLHFDGGCCWHESRSYQQSIRDFYAGSVSENRGYYLEYTASVATSKPDILIRFSTLICDHTHQPRIFREIHPDICTPISDGSPAACEAPLKNRLQKKFKLADDEPLYLVQQSLSFNTICGIDPFPAFATLFQALLNRELTAHEYEAHFHGICMPDFVGLIIRSDEFICKHIFERLTECDLTRLDCEKDLNLCVPSFWDDSICVCLQIQTDGRTICLIIPLHIRESFFLGHQLLTTAEAAVSASLEEQRFYSLFLSMSRVVEIVRGLVNRVQPKVSVDADIFSRYQSQYGIADLHGVFEQSNDVMVTLTTPPAIQFQLRHQQDSSNPNIFLAIPG